MVASQYSKSHHDPKLAYLTSSFREKILNPMTHISSVLLWQTNKKGELVSANQEYMHYFGFDNDDHLSEVDWPIILHPDDRQCYMRNLMLATQNESYFHERARVKHSDGSWRWIESRANPNYAENGEFQGMVGSSPEVTELLEECEKLKVIDKNKIHFMAELAHEMRNSISLMKNSVSLLGVVTEQKRDSIEGLMDTQITQLANLIDDLMDMAVIDAGNMKMHMGCYPIKHLIENAVENSHEVVTSSGRKLDICLHAEDAYVEADDSRINQIIINLINNAVKYTPLGGTITVTSSKEEERVYISIKDNGIGIPAEKIDGIFDLYNQIESPITRTTKGAGIGLSVVQKLVRLHGGDIHVYSDGLNTGTEFVFFLPIIKDPYQGEKILIMHIDKDHCKD